MTRKNMAEQVFQDALNAIKESQSDLEKAISGYTSGISNKPLIDIIDDVDNLIIKADLPGFRKEDINIDIGDYTLEIIAKYYEEEPIEGTVYLKRERKYGQLRRVIELPERIKSDFTQATFNDGVLQIVLPKLEKSEVNIE